MNQIEFQRQVIREEYVNSGKKKKTNKKEGRKSYVNHPVQKRNKRELSNLMR